MTSYGRLPIMMRIYFQENNKWLLKYWHVERIFNLVDWHDKIKFNTPAVTGDRVGKKNTLRMLNNFQNYDQRQLRG